jgi:hypothetical protein
LSQDITIKAARMVHTEIVHRGADVQFRMHMFKDMFVYICTQRKIEREREIHLQHLIVWNAAKILSVMRKGCRFQTKSYSQKACFGNLKTQIQLFRQLILKLEKVALVTLKWTSNFSETIYSLVYQVSQTPDHLS